MIKSLSQYRSRILIVFSSLLLSQFLLADNFASPNIRGYCLQQYNILVLDRFSKKPNRQAIFEKVNPNELVEFAVTEKGFILLREQKSTKVFKLNHEGIFVRFIASPEERSEKIMFLSDRTYLQRAKNYIAGSRIQRIERVFPTEHEQIRLEFWDNWVEEAESSSSSSQTVSADSTKVVEDDVEESKVHEKNPQPERENLVNPFWLSLIDKLNKNKDSTKPKAPQKIVETPQTPPSTSVPNTKKRARPNEPVIIDWPDRYELLYGSPSLCGQLNDDQSFGLDDEEIYPPSSLQPITEGQNMWGENILPRYKKKKRVAPSPISYGNPYQDFYNSEFHF